MNLGQFHQRIKKEINKGSSVDALIPDFVREAAKYLEANYTFGYMRGFLGVMGSGLPLEVGTRVLIPGAAETNEDADFQGATLFFNSPQTSKEPLERFRLLKKVHFISLEETDGTLTKLTRNDISDAERAGWLSDNPDKRGTPTDYAVFTGRAIVDSSADTTQVSYTGILLYPPAGAAQNLWVYCDMKSVWPATGLEDYFGVGMGGSILDVTHPLISDMTSLLIAQTMIQAAPFLREPGLTALYTSLRDQQLRAFEISDEEVERNSTPNRKMEYKG